jgi:hypothetical protein
VTAPNAPPVATADGFSGTEDHAIVVAPPGVLANDSDPNGDPIRATGASAPAHGVLVLAPDGSFSYTPAPNFSGTDGFTYQATDGSLTSAPASVQLTIAPVNDAPSFQVGPDQTAIAALNPVSVPGWATAISPGPPDEAGQTVAFTVQVTSGADLFGAAPAVSPEGTLTYTPSGATGHGGVERHPAGQRGDGRRRGGYQRAAELQDHADGVRIGHVTHLLAPRDGPVYPGYVLHQHRFRRRPSGGRPHRPVLAVTRRLRRALSDSEIAG